MVKLYLVKEDGSRHPAGAFRIEEYQVSGSRCKMCCMDNCRDSIGQCGCECHAVMDTYYRIKQGNQTVEVFNNKPEAERYIQQSRSNQW